MATNIEVNELKINKMSESTLSSMEKAGTIGANQIYVTDDDETSPRGLPLGTIIPVSLVSDDSSLHLADGSSLSQTGIYSQFCTWLKERVAESSNNVPTCTITEYASEMTTYGQCGKFVINDTNEVQTSNGYRVEANSIKLPTITEFIASNNGGDAIGLAELDMFKSHDHRGYYDTTFVNANVHITDTTGTDAWAGTQSFPATAPTGGEETRPKNVRYPYYIVVATSVKTDVEVDIDNVASDINAINGVLTKTEQVEVVYDINDASKDWGYTDGIQKSYISGKDFTKYKKVILFVEQAYEKGQCVIDLAYLTGSTNQYVGTNTYFSRIESGTLYNYTIYSAIGASKTAIDISCDKVGANGSSTTYGKVVKIEGAF